MNFVLSLGKRLLRTVLTAIVVLLLGVLGIWYFFLYHPEDSRPSSAGPVSGIPMVPQYPKETVGGVFRAIADHQPDYGCSLFDDPGRAQFARDLHTADCPAAIQAAAAQVRNPQSFRNPRFRDDALVQSEDQASISACAMSFDGAGPHLGAFTLRRMPNGGWIITGHQTEPADCVTG